MDWLCLDVVVSLPGKTHTREQNSMILKKVSYAFVVENALYIFSFHLEMK